MEIKFNEEVGKQIKAELGDFAVEQIEDFIALIEKLKPYLDPWLEIKGTPFSVGEFIDGPVLNKGADVGIELLNKLKTLLTEEM